MLIPKQVVSLENIAERHQNRAKTAVGNSDFCGLCRLHHSTFTVETLSIQSSVASLHRHQVHVLLRQRGGGKNGKGKTTHVQEKRKEKERKEERARGNTWGRMRGEKVSQVAGIDWSCGPFLKWSADKWGATWYSFVGPNWIFLIHNFQNNPNLSLFYHLIPQIFSLFLKFYFDPQSFKSFLFLP